MEGSLLGPCQGIITSDTNRQRNHNGGMGYHKPFRIQKQVTSGDGEYSSWEPTDEDETCKMCWEYGQFENDVDLLRLIKVCGKKKDLYKGSKIHSDILKRGLLKKDVLVGTALLSMYAKCGALGKAQEVFDELPMQDVISWTTLIDGYSQHGLGYEALKCFCRMRDDDVSPDATTFICIFKACGIIGEAEFGKEVHVEVCRQGLLQTSIATGNALVDMYAKCGLLANAKEVFDELPNRDVVSWTALIAGFVQHGLYKEALKFFGQMQDDGISPNVVTFSCIMKACSNIGAAKIGEEMHFAIIKKGLLEKSKVLRDALMDMYAVCGSFGKAQKVFDQLPTRDVVTWTILITRYAQNGFGNTALDCFKQMQANNICPNTVTYASILRACGSIGEVKIGEDIHVEINRHHLLRENIMLGTALVDMYGKCGLLEKARDIFDKLEVQDVVSWNALISGYTHHRLGNEALKCFSQMQDKGIPSDAITFSCALKACGIARVVEVGKQIHAQVINQGLLGEHIMIDNALVDMYIKCDLLSKAQKVFKELPRRDVVTWNVLISGYAQHNLADEALKCLGLMKDEGILLDATTFASILKICGNVGAAEIGQEINVEVCKQGLLQQNVALGNALVDMYMKCGLLFQAQETFDKLPVRDIITWTTLIAGYAQFGKVKRALNLFGKMVAECAEPDIVVFSVLLTACKYAGLVGEGQMHYNAMTSIYCIIPTSLHHTCMVELFSNEGHFDKAISLINRVPSYDRLALWMAMLGACQSSVNVQIGKEAFEHIVELDNKYAAAYACMSAIYANAGMQEEAEKIDALRMRNKAWKIAGCCQWMDMNGNMHSFTVGDKSHPQSKLIYARLNDIHKKLMIEGQDLQLS